MIWLTEIKRPDPLTGEPKSWCGPRIEADSWEEADEKVNHINGCQLLGVLVAEIDYQPLEMVWTN